MYSVRDQRAISASSPNANRVSAIRGVFKRAVLHKMCSSKNSECSSKEIIQILLKEIPVKVECCLYIIISDKHGNKTCILSVLARQVHVVYVYMNEGIFLNIVATKNMQF